MAASSCGLTLRLDEGGMEGMEEKKSDMQDRTGVFIKASWMRRIEAWLIKAR